MAKRISSQLLDLALNEVRNTGNLMVGCPSEPASFGAAQSSKLVETTMAPADYTIGAGSPSGRRVTTAAKNSLTPLANGTVNHIAILDTAGSRLLLVTTCPAQAVTITGSVNIQSLTLDIRDPD